MSTSYEAIANIADFWFCVHNTVVNGRVNTHDANMA